MKFKDVLDAEVMKLYMSYGQLQIQKKSIEQQIEAVESKLSAINQVLPIAIKIESTNISDLKAPNE